MHHLMKTSTAVILLIIYASKGTVQGAIQRSFDIFNGKVISADTVFSTTIVPSACHCRNQCFTVPYCTAWSMAEVNGENECKLAEGFPSVIEQAGAVFGVVPHGAPNYTPAPPTTPTTTTIDPTTYIMRFEEDKECSADRVISAVAMLPNDPNHSNPKYTVCWRANTGVDFKLDGGDMEVVATGPTDTPTECTGNRVFVDLTGYSDSEYSQKSVRANPPFMQVTCELLLNWVVDYNDCQTAFPETTAWPYVADSGAQTELWDYWISCPPFFLPTMLTRELNGDQNVVASMKCCRINA